jgi:hypothetical protein
MCTIKLDLSLVRATFPRYISGSTTMNSSTLQDPLETRTTIWFPHSVYGWTYCYGRESIHCISYTSPRRSSVAHDLHGKASPPLQFYPLDTAIKTTTMLGGTLDPSLSQPREHSQRSRDPEIFSNSLRDALHSSSKAQKKRIFRTR